MQRLEGRIAVITGAASGIGRALALQLAEAGCGLALVDVQAETLRRVGAECRERGAQVSTHAVDVSDRAAMAALPQRVIDFHGAVHILINNAGVTVADTVLEQSLEDWDWIVGINLWGVIYGCRAFLPHLLAAEEAHIVNLSSVFGIAGVPMQAAYCTTKFAVLGFSESLQAELRGTCVGLSVVHPGGVNTNIVRASRMRDEDAREKLTGIFDRLALTPETAAALIVAGIRRSRERVLIGWEAYCIDALKRLAPIWSRKLLLGTLSRALGIGDVSEVYRRGGGAT